MSLLKSCPLPLRAGVALCLASGAAAKPSPAPGHPPAAVAVPAPLAENRPTDPVARWLAEQNGGDGAILLPFAQVVHAATGKNVLPANPADLGDAAALARCGAALDQILPRMNRPDSPAQTAARLGEMDEAAARFEDELRATLTPAAKPAPGDALGSAFNQRHYPAVRFTEKATGKTYYLAVAFSHAGKTERVSRAAGAIPALTFHPADARAITADGCCLLADVEYDGSPGANLAFLNWRLLDVANALVRLAATFEAEGSTSQAPAGAVLTDGRKGRD